MAPDIGKIKSNISLMADQGATEEEIDIYVASEGTSAEELSAAPQVDPNTRLQEMMADRNVPIPDIEKFVADNGFDVGINGPAMKAFAEWKRTPEGQAYKGPQGNIELQEAAPELLDPETNDAALRMAARPGTIMNGVIPRLGDTLAGVGGTLANAFMAPFSDQVDFEPGKSFDEGFDLSTRTQKAYEKNDPSGYKMGTDAGFGLGMFAPVTKIGQAPKAAALLTRKGAEAATKYGIVNGTATGTAYGGFTGALNDSGAGRVENSLWGSAGGATVGALATPVVKGVTGAGQWLGRVAPPLGNAFDKLQAKIAQLRGIAPDIPIAQRQGQRIIAEDMKAGNIATGMGTGDVPMTAQSMTDEIVSRNADGMPAMPADMSDQLRRRTSWALQGLGPMATRARTTLASRQASQGGRISQRVQEEMGAVADPIRTAELITQRASDAAAPAYREAYDAGVVITPEIQRLIDSPAFQSSIGQARTNILNRGGDPENIGVFQNAAGEASLGTAPTLEAMDHVISTVRGDVARDAFGNQIRNRSAGAEQAAVGDLDALLRRQNGLYDDAKTNFADEMSIKDALADGSKVGKMSGHELNGYLRNTPEHAREAWMLAAGRATSDKAVVAGQRPTADVSMAIRKDLGLSGAGQASSMGDNVKVTALDQMSGRPGMMANLDRKLENEAQGFKTFNEAYGNSKTNSRETLDSDIMAGVARTARDAIAFGNPIAALTTVVSGLATNGTRSFRKEIEEYISKTLTEQNPANIQEAFKAIEARAAKDDNFKALLNRAGIQLSRLSSTGLGGADGDPFVPQE